VWYKASMSSFQENQADDKKERRRRPTGNRRRKPSEDAAERPKVERPPAVPFPSDLIGKNCTGIVNAVVRRGRIRFGFINLGNDEKANDVPRIYFGFEGIPEDVHFRRGYPVEFVAKLDDKGRTNAVDVKLTEGGKSVAEEREKVIAEKRADRAAAFAAAAAAGHPIEERKRKPRPAKGKGPRGPRPPREDRPLTIKVTCAGHTEAKMLEINLSHSVGKLKNIACTAFDAPMTYNVYHVTAENADGVYLTKSILNKFTANDAVHLAEAKEKA